MRRLSIALLCAGCFLNVATARAQSQDEIKNIVLGLYIVSVAVDTCDLPMTKDQEKSLEGWIEWAEKKLNVADRKLETAYAEMEKAAEKDKKAFCSEMTPVAAQTLKELPKDVP